MRDSRVVHALRIGMRSRGPEVLDPCAHPTLPMSAFGADEIECSPVASDAVNPPDSDPQTARETMQATAAARQHWQGKLRGGAQAHRRGQEGHRGLPARRRRRPAARPRPCRRRTTASPARFQTAAACSCARARRPRPSGAARRPRARAGRRAARPPAQERSAAASGRPPAHRASAERCRRGARGSHLAPRERARRGPQGPRAPGRDRARTRPLDDLRRRRTARVGARR